MQNFIVSLLLLSCSIPVFAGSMTVASSVLREAPTHQFVNLDAEPLWTSEVRRIDVSKQAYERLPAVIAPETLVAEAAAKASSPELATADATPQSVNDTPSSSDATELARNWCSAKYRSYSPVDNTYQPYGGGERKACVAPEELTAPATIQTASADTDTLDIGHIQWCMERYSSYREDDNSYQPYSGPRKKCLPPEQQSASNRYGMVAQEYH